MTDRELMQMSLDALLWVDEEQRIFSQRESIRRLRDRLAQPEPEPVLEEPKFWISTGIGHKKPLYIAPVHATDISEKRVDETAKHRHEWVGLSAAETENITRGAVTLLKVALETEAKLKEKNT